MTGNGLSAPRSGCAPASNCIETETTRRAPFGQKAPEFFISIPSFRIRLGRGALAADVVTIAAAVKMLVCKNARRSMAWSSYFFKEPNLVVPTRLGCLRDANPQQSFHLEYAVCRLQRTSQACRSPGGP